MQGRPLTFFQGWAKFSWRGQNYTICLKNALKHTIFFQKSQKHTILAGQGGKYPLFPSPVDAHGRMDIRHNCGESENVVGHR